MAAKIFKNIEIKCKIMHNSILYKEHKNCIDLFPMCVPIFSKIVHIFTELWPLQNSHEFELSPLPWKCQQLFPLICIIWIHIKEQKLLAIYWSICIPYMKWIGWSTDKLLPFDGILLYFVLNSTSNYQHEYKQYQIKFHIALHTWS